MRGYSLFEVKYRGELGIRVGRFDVNEKELDTPSPFAISNIGGGQADVDRLVSYIDIFYSSRMPLLFNFYYLTRGGRFAVKWTRDIGSYEDILDFVSRQKLRLHKEGRVSTSFNLENVRSRNRPITLLDSGSGNFLRDFARQGFNIDRMRREFEKLVPEMLDFASAHKFDIVIGLDYASKSTYKDEETSDDSYIAIADKLVNSKSDNLSLLAQNLYYLKSKERPFMLYAPVHGDNLQTYTDFCKELLSWEDNEGVRFDGFALGGISPKIASPSWKVPSHSGRLMSTWYLYYYAGKAIRELLVSHGDHRPIHGLGLGAAKNVIPLVLAGVDTFDAHTPWRRAINGSHKVALAGDLKGSHSKYLTPVFNREGLAYPNQLDGWDYKELPTVDDSTVCDCIVCSKFPVKRLKQLYFSKDNEEYYLSRILLYCHAIFQAGHTCNALVSAAKSKESFKHFIETLPLEFRQSVLRLIS